MTTAIQRLRNVASILATLTLPDGVLTWSQDEKIIRMHDGVTPGGIKMVRGDAAAITGGAINGAAVGNTTPATGAFTTLSAGATTASTMAVSSNATVGGNLTVGASSSASATSGALASSTGAASVSTTTSGTLSFTLLTNTSGATNNGVPTGCVGFGTQGIFAPPIVFAQSSAEKARFDPGSNGLLIGYTASNGAFKLQVNSQIFATSATVATSDAKFKTNVVPLASALDLVCALKPAEFDFIPDDVHNFPAGRQIGFIAQDVQAALAGTDYLNSLVFENTREEQPAVEARDAVPEQPAVLDDDDNVITPEVPAQDAVAAQAAIPGDTFLGLADAGFTPLVVKALQELAAQVADLKSQVAALSPKAA